MSTRRAPAARGERRRGAKRTLVAAAMKALATTLILCAAMISPRAACADEGGPPPKALTSLWLEQQLVAHGAKFVVDQLWAHQRYDDVMAQMSSGKSDWIALAPKLAGGTDAGTAEELIISLALALPINPGSVLATLGSDQDIPTAAADVCGAPFIEGTVKNIADYLRRSIKAVAAIRNPALARQKTACLDELHKAVEELKVDGK